MYIADLHIHSRYSRATSKDCTPEYLDLWARKKGIDILGTGDFTHPAWREELKEKLEPAEDGLYVLKKEYRVEDEGAPDDKKPRFVITGEISSIYKKMDRVRKVHSLLLLPGLEEADRLARRLELIGNIHSDGRPILGLDCRDLLEIMLETCPDAVYVPAHIWTPHFSLFGAFSGFDRIEDCFEDLTPYIHALETGLSSDPPMNWRVSALDSYYLISNSDAHSPSKLGREANLLDIEMSYSGLAGAINKGEGLAGTLEFFPEEGKYHFDGHRKCGLSLKPGEALKLGGKCPICGKKLTIGVLHRVEELADKDEGRRSASARPFESLAPLPEVIAASTGRGAGTKKVQEQYLKMLKSIGPEFYILRSAPAEDIKKTAGPLIAEGIKRLREGKVERTPGFDGEYGTIRLLRDSEISMLEGQISLFTQAELKEQEKKQNLFVEKQFYEQLSGASLEFSIAKEHPANDPPGKEGAEEPKIAGEHSRETWEMLNPRQQEAVVAMERAVAVIAGPGSGKTKTLIARLIYMLEERKVKPSEITAVTFTNKAAGEIRERLERLPGGKRLGKRLTIGTFHSICSRLLTESGMKFHIADDGLKEEYAREAKEKFNLKLSANRFLRELSYQKNTGKRNETQEDNIPQEAFDFYQEKLHEAGAFDYDDLLWNALSLFLNGDPDAALKKNFSYLLVDEFQDINPIQYQLIQAWNQEGKELFVIGDPDQSIYGFRGSDAHCFERLQEDYTGLRRIGLTENYRSTPQILTGALSVISRNDGAKRQMKAVGKSGRDIRIVTAPDERKEAIFVAKEINRLIGGIDMLDVEEGEGRRGKSIRSFSDIAVLYRVHRQARLLEYCLRQEGIPYVIAGREDFLLENRVRGALYFFQYALHPEDRLAGELAEKLLFPEALESAGEQLAYLLEKYEKKAHKTKPMKLLEAWAKEWKLEEDEAINKMIDMSVLHSSMDNFLHTLSLGEDGDIRRCGGRKFLSDAVTLTTLHGSKGLEFPAVFLYGMRKNTLPVELSKDPSALQEERRLFYVGMTRAREELILTASAEESAFIKEIAKQVVKREEANKEKPAEEAEQLSLFDYFNNKN